MPRLFFVRSLRIVRRSAGDAELWSGTPMRYGGFIAAASTRTLFEPEPRRAERDDYTMSPRLGLTVFSAWRTGGLHPRLHDVAPSGAGDGCAWRRRALAAAMVPRSGDRDTTEVRGRWRPVGPSGWICCGLIRRVSPVGSPRRLADDFRVPGLQLERSGDLHRPARLHINSTNPLCRWRRGWRARREWRS
jgi:hypothetical protein